MEDVVVTKETPKTKVMQKLIMEVVENEVMKEGPFEGERRIYTLREHRGIEDYFAGALAEAGKGETFQGAICVYKKADGSIGISYHVSKSAKVVARTPGGAEEPYYHHYRPNGETVGSYGRIMAEDLKPNETAHLKEHGKAITEKLVALSNSWCGGIYYCG